MEICKLSYENSFGKLREVVIPTDPFYLEIGFKLCDLKRKYFNQPKEACQLLENVTSVFLLICILLFCSNLSPNIKYCTDLLWSHSKYRENGHQHTKWNSSHSSCKLKVFPSLSHFNCLYFNFKEIFHVCCRTSWSIWTFGEALQKRLRNH